MKNAKKWFAEHPKSIVVYHWRWNDLPPASRERLSTTRTATLVGHRVMFSDGSEASLRDMKSYIGLDNLLTLFNKEDKRIVVYKAV